MSNNLNTLTDLVEVGSRNDVNEEATTYSESYFDALYQDNTDPWQYQTRWYEKRKRDMCLAVLPQAEYGRAIELGCGNGVFSELLAQRCQSLLSIDGNKQAVQLAQQRLADLSHVRVIQGVIPNVLFTIDNEPVSDKPLALKVPFDLIVLFYSIQCTNAKPITVKPVIKIPLDQIFAHSDSIRRMLPYI